jgi:hypothetical protein
MFSHQFVEWRVSSVAEFPPQQAFLLHSETARAATCAIARLHRLD